MNHIAAFLLSASLILKAWDDTTGNSDSTITSFNTTSQMTYPVKHISVSINKPPEEVYRFSSNPENFPKWVAFVHSMSRQGDIWLASTDIGDIKIKFAAINDFGIVDHEVTFPDGETVSNPMRVIANHQGSEFNFTLFWRSGRTEKEFNEDANAVKADLQKLKDIMEH